jgi:hypothetical protein
LTITVGGEEIPITAAYDEEESAYELIVIPAGATINSLTIGMQNCNTDENVYINFFYVENDPDKYESPWGTLSWENNQWNLYVPAGDANPYVDLSVNRYILEAEFIDINDVKVPVQIEVIVDSGV